LGKKLPPKKDRKVPAKGFTVKVKGKFNPSPKKKGKGEPPREREIDVTFSGPDAVAFASNPNLVDFFEAYGVDGQQFSDAMTGDFSISIN
jgi:hypothetical protein